MLCDYLFNPRIFVHNHRHHVQQKKKFRMLRCYSALLNTHVPEQGFTDSTSCGAVIVIQTLCLTFPENLRCMYGLMNNTEYIVVHTHNERA